MSLKDLVLYPDLTLLAVLARFWYHKLNNLLEFPYSSPIIWSIQISGYSISNLIIPRQKKAPKKRNSKGKEGDEKSSPARPIKRYEYAPLRVAELASMYPDEYWTSYPAIDLINKDHALRLLPTKLVTKGAYWAGMICGCKQKAKKWNSFSLIPVFFQPRFTAWLYHTTVPWLQLLLPWVSYKSLM